MSAPAIAALIEELASLVALAEPCDAGFSELDAAAAPLEAALGQSPLLHTFRQASAAAKALRATRPAEALQALAQAVSALQLGFALPLAPPGPPRAVVRDAEALELFRDFLQEAGDGVTLADELLMKIEAGALDAEKVNALFRVFHSIKGVAGFLDCTEIAGLAHITESLMNEVRDGRRRLEGEALEWVFTATAVLTRLLAGVRSAVQAGTELVPSAETEPLKAKIAAFIAAPPAPSVPPQGAPTPPPQGATAAPPPLATAPAPAPPASAPPPNPSAPAGSGRLRETVKVDLERVDGMVEMIGELIIVESMLVHAPELASPRFRNTLNQLSKISRDLQDAAMRMRTVPVQGAFQKMARLARELGRKAGKEVVLNYQGEGTEMDRSMVERLEDPLVHMVRNAVDHGLESTQERLAAGKPGLGQLTLSAYYEGGSIVIELADDGRGLQREKILAKALERGVARPGQTLSDSEVFNFIFAPGFSTAAQVTQISGRGVGMDVVKRAIEAMRGRVVIASRPGSGSTFRMVLPLTLAIIDGMLVQTGTERYLIPSLSIVESLQPKRSMLSTMGEHDELLTVRGQVLPLVRLSKLFGIAGARADPTEALVVVVESVGKRAALLVDQVITQQQVVIKPLGSGVGKAELYSGAAILSDGCVGLILNVDRLCGLVKRRHPLARGAEEARP